jgi:hypothetical protein
VRVADVSRGSPMVSSADAHQRRRGFSHRPHDGWMKHTD